MQTRASASRASFSLLRKQSLAETKVPVQHGYSKACPACRLNACKLQPQHLKSHESLRGKAHAFGARKARRLAGGLGLLHTSSDSRPSLPARAVNLLEESPGSALLAQICEFETTKALCRTDADHHCASPCGKAGRAKITCWKYEVLLASGAAGSLPKKAK